MIQIINRPFLIARGSDLRRISEYRPTIERRELLIEGVGLLAFAGIAGGLARYANAATTYIATPEETEGAVLDRRTAQPL